MMPTSHSERIVAFDLDGTLVHHDHLDRLNAEFGTSYTHKDITSFDYESFPYSQRVFLWNQWQCHDLYDADHLSRATKDTLENLRETARVIVVSAPLPGSIESKYNFLLRNFDEEDIFLTYDKTLIKADILVDDAPHNIHAWPGHVIIFDQPYNKGIPGPRARSISDVGPLVLDYYLSQGVSPDDL